MKGRLLLGAALAALSFGSAHAVTVQCSSDPAANVTTIQNALNNGGTVTVGITGASPCLIQAPGLLLTVPGTVLSGVVGQQGHVRTTLLAATPNANTFDLVSMGANYAGSINSQSVTVQNIILDGNQQVDPGTVNYPGHGIYVHVTASGTPTVPSVINNVTVQNTSDGISSNASYLLVENSHITYSWHGGFYSAGVANGSVPAAYAHTHDITVQGNSLDHITLSNQPGKTWDGIDFGPNNGQAGYGDIYILNNLVDGSDILVGNPAAPQGDPNVDIHINSNTVQNATHALYPHAQSFAFRLFSQSQNITLSGNTANNDDMGFYVYGGAQNITIDNSIAPNVVVNNAASTMQAVSIQPDPGDITSDTISVVGNNLTSYGNKNPAVSVNAATNVTVMGNTLVNNGTGGLIDCSLSPGAVCSPNP